MVTDATSLTLTIFTPAYNRATLLPRLFASIKAQVEPGDAVEWLVIDDGSTDDTQAVLSDFAEERPDLVRYLAVSNGGKHRAINRAAQEARGAWVMIVDSDDALVEGALSQVRHTIDQVDDNAAIGVLRALRRFPELTAEHHFAVPDNPSRYVAWCSHQQTFDTAEVVRRASLQRHPFPDYAGERFMAEGWLWHALDQTDLTLFVDQPWVASYYQESGLTASSRTIRAMSPRGAMTVYAAMLTADLPRQWRMRAAANWWRYRCHARRLGKPVAQPAAASVLFAPVGWLLYLSDRHRTG